MSHFYLVQTKSTSSLSLAPKGAFKQSDSSFLLRSAVPVFSFLPSVSFYLCWQTRSVLITQGTSGHKKRIFINAIQFRYRYQYQQFHFVNDFKFSCRLLEDEREQAYREASLKRSTNNLDPRVLGQPGNPRWLRSFFCQCPVKSCCDKNHQFIPVSFKPLLCSLEIEQKAIRF